MNEEFNDDKKEEQTKEINLDELYDGSVNNTVIIDPITNKEVILERKKRSKIFVICLCLIILALVLYFVINKTSFGNLEKDVKPTFKKKTKVTEKIEDSGTLVCTYNSNGDSQSESAKYTLVYENGKIINSIFNYSVVSNTDILSDTLNDLISQYEKFYIDNSNVSGYTVSFTKNEKGFTEEVKSDYSTLDYDSINIEDGKMLLYVKPLKDYNKDSLKELYEKKGYSCILGEIEKGEEVNE